MALTKAEIAEALFNQLGLNKREARELVDLFFEEIRAALATGGQVKLSGFGNFDLRDKNQRPGRNPKTGEEIPISARRVVTFTAWPASIRWIVRTSSPEEAASSSCVHFEDSRVHFVQNARNFGSLVSMSAVILSSLSGWFDGWTVPMPMLARHDRTPTACRQCA